MIERLRRPDWLAWLLTVGALLALVGPLSLLLEFGEPFGGYITFQHATRPYNEIDLNSPIWWSGLINNRAQHADRLISVDSQPHATNAREAYATAVADGQASVLLRVERGESNQTLNLPIPIDTFGWSNFFDARMPDLVTGFVLWLAAIIVYLAHPEEGANRGFALVAAVAGYGRVLYVHSLFFDNPYDVAVELLLITTLAFLGPSLIYFTANFPEPAKQPWVRFVVQVAFLLGFVALAAEVIARTALFPLHLRDAGQSISYYLTIVMLFVGLAALAIRLFRMFAHSGTSKRERRIAIILLVGFGLSAPAFLASGAKALTLGEQQPFYFWLGLDLRYLLLFVPLAFGFVLVRYHAMKAPSAIFIFLVALTSSALAAALAAWAWTLVQPTWPDNGIRPPFLALFAVALMTSLFWSTTARWRGLLGRNLDWERYSNASLRAFGRRITTATDEDLLPEAIVGALVADFGLEQAAIWLRRPGTSVLALTAQDGESATQLPDTILLAQPDAGGYGAPVRTADEIGIAEAWSTSLDQVEGLEVMVPLVVEGDLLGLLGLGQRWDEEVYDDRDLETAELVGQQAALFLVAARYIQELKRVPGRMADAQERERMRLARELHDTVQQFLGRLPFYLAVSRDSFAIDPEKSAELLDRAIADVELAAQAVRQIRHNLAPSQLERGLAQSLIALTTAFQWRTGLQTSLSFPKELDSATNQETSHAIYRVVQQALDNVEAHAAATRIAVRLIIADGRVMLTVSDNGRGGTDEERQAARSRGSFGIQSMTARLVGAGGGMSVESRPGHGLEIKGWVPVTISTTTSDTIPGTGWSGSPHFGSSSTVPGGHD